MKLQESSLRSLIEKWLAPSASAPVHITRLTFANSRIRCVLARRSTSPTSLSIFFFRHADGVWRVFPPAPRKPEMRFRTETG
ncbi:conserved hypothetical protein [Burkholderia orbicola MC0-3]|uniref:Uncharacterized protein n=1 Tax=Burkholderia orbicola (strain MC0-3) TaxID=406425 RepID=B1KCL9_BURO0|nr:conserved hypothetical protein [Burkholderia orbicola MC0-3]RQV54378.1 hypothetical protein DF024_33300 [Burkholderia cenocepacia]